MKDDAGPAVTVVTPGAPGWLRLATVSLQLLALLLLGVAAQAIVLGNLEHLRAQKVAYTALRNELARATAPVSQLDNDGHLLRAGAPLAILEIPELGMRQVVFEGTTSDVLKSGPGHRRDTVLPGQAGTSVVYGRKATYGGPFSGLDRLGRGSSISVTTGQGRSVFRVTGVRTAGDSLPAAVVAGKGRLTLITATGAPFLPSGVLYVDADLVSDTKPTPNQLVGPASLTAAELPLAGDPGGWVPIVIFGEFLLAVALGIVWARQRWGPRQAWLVGVPLVLAFGLAVADNVLRLLPNLM